MSTVTFNLKNNGPHNTKAAFVAFDGLDSLIVESIVPSKGSMRDNVWSVGELDLDETASVTIKATPKEGVSFTVRARAYGNTADINMRNNYAEFTVGGNNQPSCEVQLNYDPDNPELDYLKFSIKTTDEVVRDGEVAPLFYYSVFDPDTRVGEFVSEIPEGLMEFYINAYGYDGDTSPFNQIEVYGLGAADATHTAYVRKPTTPLNHADLFENVNDFGGAPVGEIVDSLVGQELCAVLGLKYQSVNIPVVASTHDFRVRTSGELNAFNPLPIDDCPDTKQAVELYGIDPDGLNVFLSYKKGNATTPVGKIDYDMEGVEEIHIFAAPDSSRASILVRLAPGTMPSNMYLYEESSGATLYRGDNGGNGLWKSDNFWFDDSLEGPERIILHFSYHGGM